MKKVQRSFAVEYKSGRRKPDLKSNSIWGDVDLKSVARDVEKEATLFLLGKEQVGKSDELSLQQKDHAGAVSTLSSAMTTESDAQETGMADEIDTMSTAEAAATVETPIAPKQRKPRAKKAAAEAAPASDNTVTAPAGASNGDGGKQKRGRKAKAVEAPASAKRAYQKRAPKAAQTAAAEPTVASDEMADLLQLEAENQKLRKLLAEKLRAENADLRKRLKLD
ncbi:transcriptional regulator [Oryzicola mucosus]|uniref:Transcriptional regulator n=1 Tax=Oryzicola mucosus TaxID=2767425 RepID=A0A8J6PPR4_9HYPH|nr:transcriptional regulator [Oryzicola mucosus]MBD0415590.1 transcriptional regulator [Oryzicola mucosus]